MNKPKSRRSSRKSGYYTAQRARTAANKARQAIARKARADKWKAIRAKEVAAAAPLPQ